MLNASQKRTKRARLHARVDVEHAGEHAPAGSRRCRRRARRGARSRRRCSARTARCTSKNSPSSTTRADRRPACRRACSGPSGRRVERRVASRSTGSSHGSRAADPRVVRGQERAAARARPRRHASSSRRAKCATPVFVACVVAPPSSSLRHLLVGHGPDDVGARDEHVARAPSTMKMKSVIAGEYTAPPAHGPMIALNLRDDAGRERVAQEDVGVAARATRRPPGCARRPSRSGR